MHSNYFRLIAAIGGVSVVSIVQAGAVSFAPFNVSTTNVGGTTTFQGYQLPATSSGQVFTSYSVTIDWVPATNFNTQKVDAIWAFVDQPEPLPPETTFYADPGPSAFVPLHAAFPNGIFGAGKLTWYGVFYNDQVTRSSNGTVIGTGGHPTLVPGGTPLYFDYGQVAPYTTTSWNNVTITLNDRPIINSTFGGVVDKINGPKFDRPYTTDGEGPNSSSRKNTAYDVKPFTVDTTGIYQISTASDPVSNGTGSQWFADLFIYADSFNPASSLTNLLAEDGLVAGGYLDQPNIIGLQLEAGRQYYLVESQSLAVGRGGAYTGMVHGEGNLTFGVIPEPAGAALVAVPALLSLRRRR